MSDAETQTTPEDKTGGETQTMAEGEEEETQTMVEGEEEETQTMAEGEEEETEAMDTVEVNTVVFGFSCCIFVCL